MSSNRVTATQAVAANLKVDPSGVTSPVSAASLPLPSGAATAALQAGGLPAALGAGGGLKVDGSGTALPVSSTTLATVAKQPALGTAGTASADVITVQGIASGLPITTRLDQIDISQTPTVTNAGAYAVQDAVGGLLTFANAARLSGGTGILQTLRVMCKTPALLPALELWLFNVTFTAMADNGTWSPSDADMANYIGTIPIAAWADTTLNSGATRFGLGFSYALAGTSLFGQLVTRTAVTFTSTSDIIIGITCIRD